MKSAFAPLSLKWRLAAGAKLPGLRSCADNADGGCPVADATPDAVKADHLLQALAVGATEDELVAATPGALTVIYHPLAQSTTAQRARPRPTATSGPEGVLTYIYGLGSASGY